MEPNKRPVALITGAAKNTGFATARLFAKRGYDVCVTSRKGEAADAAASLIMKETPGAAAVGYELLPSDVEQTRATFRKVKERFGRLDAFVANATAIALFQNILNTSPKDYDYTMESNAKAYFFGTQEAAKLMIECGAGGSIVLVGSVHSRQAVPNRIVYAISKCAIEGLGRNAAYELGKYGIRVNCLVAGAIVNERFEQQTEEEKNARRSNWPLGRESYPGDVAKAICFLSSDEAATITGTSLVVDSGVCACLLKYEKNWEKNERF